MYFEGQQNGNIQTALSMSAEEIEELNVNDLYQILMTTNVKQRLKPFVKKFKRKNIPFIYQTLSNLIQVLNGKKEAPLMKFNALMAVKLFFDTGQYVVVTLIEIYLLPIIYEIASYRVQKRSQEGVTLFFIEKGYAPTKQTKRIGFNFVLLALQFLFMAAQVKPYRNVENIEIEEASQFSKLAKSLLEKGVEPIQSYIFYLPSYVNHTRKKYLKRLNKFNPDEYVQYFLKLTCDELNLNNKPGLDMKKMMSYADAYYTIPLLNICEDELSNMETNFPNKKKYLNLIGDFIKAGDIFAVLILTRSSFLEIIYEEIQKVEGDTGLEAGDKIYPRVEATKAEKRQFYTQFLKYIDIWAYCHPYDEDEEPTDAKKIFDVLKNTRNFKFPPNILQSKIKSQMEANLKLNKDRNEKILKLVDDLSSYDSRRKASMEMSKSKLSKKSNKLNQSSVNSLLQFDQFEDIVKKTQKKLDLIDKEETLPQTMAALQKFQKFWLTIQQKNQIDADQSDDVQLIIEQGSRCNKMIDLVLPIYKLFKQKAISYDQYIDRISLLMKTQDQKNREVSIQERLEPSSVIMEEISSVRTSKYFSKASEDINQQSRFASRFRKSKVSRHSKISQESQPQVFSKVSQSHLYIGYDQKDEIYNDYEIKIDQKEQVKRQQKGKAKDGLPHQNDASNDFSNKGSIHSSRSNSRSSRILQRRGKKSKLIPQCQYQDIFNQSKSNQWENIMQKDYQPNDSFISSEHSSLKQNKPKSKLSLLKSHRSQDHFNQSIQELNIQAPSVNEYYAQNGEQKSSFIQFDSPSGSKVIQLSEFQRAIQMQKNKQRKPLTSNNKNSVLKSKSSDILADEDNTFKIYTQSNGPVSHSKGQISESNQSSIIDLYEKKKFEEREKMIKKLLYEREQSIIQEPDLKPLVHSFHEGLDTSQYLPNTNKASDFKVCFQVNHEIISSKERSQKMFKFARGKIVNFIETVYSKETPRNSSIADMLSQRNAREAIEGYRKERINQRPKIKEIETQSEKGRSLENFNKNMRMKFVLKRQQQSNKEEAKVMQTLKKGQNDQNGSVHESEHLTSEPPLRKSATNANLKGVPIQILSDNKVPDQIRAINTKIYSHYFTQSKAQKTKKCMLKSKALLLKNDEFQIGYVCTKRQKCINIVLFITPLKDTIEDINLLLAHDQNINIKLSADYIEEIKTNTQQNVNLQISVENVPYVMPSLNFKFKKNYSYSHNQMLITIPCSFNKFVDFHPFAGQPPHSLKDQQKGQEIIRIQEFKYSTKLMDPNKIKQSLSQFSLVEQRRHETVYVSQVYFRGKIFIIKLILNDNGKMSMQGINMTGDHKNIKYIQFLLITFHQIFQSTKPPK